MGFTTDTLSLYHTFSKTPVDSNSSSAAAQLGNAINKSGHTVQSSEVWAEEIPFFGLAATTAAAHSKFSATARTNDLVMVGSTIYQRNATAYTEGATFETLWAAKTTSITSTTKNEDGSYPTASGALVNGSYLLNAAGVPVIKYHFKQPLTILTAENNANTDSDNKASRLQIDGKWVEQFVGVTDSYLNGSAAVSYAPVIFASSTTTTPSKPGAGQAYMDYCATGTILWEADAKGTEVITCFEYVGKKLAKSLGDIESKIQQAVSGAVTGITKETGAAAALSISGEEGDGYVYGAVTIDLDTVKGSTKTIGETTTTYSSLTNLAEQGYVDELVAGVSESSSELADLVGTIPSGFSSETVVEYVSDKIDSVTLSNETDIDSVTSDEDKAKLVSAQHVIDYVDNNAKVSVGTSADDVEAVKTLTFVSAANPADITVSVDKDGASDDNGAATITIGASLTKATVKADGSFVDDQASLAVSATSAKAIATKVAADNDAITSITIEGATSPIAIDNKNVVIPAATTEAAGVTKLYSNEVAANDESTDATAATVASVAKTRAAIEKQISAATLTGTSSNGITINQGAVGADGTVTPTTITVTPAEVSEGAITAGDEAKLVTASDAQSIASKAVTDATLAADTEIVDTTTDNEGKLVSASQVKTYVSENAKVSVSADNSAVPAEAVTSIKVAGNSGTDVVISTAKDTAADPADGAAIITVSATLNKASVATNGTITNGSLAVSATDAATIAKAAVDAIGVDGEWSQTITHEAIDDKTAITSTQSISVAIDLDNTDKKVTVNATDIASATALERLKSHVNALHTTPQFDVVVFSGETAMADFEAATKVANRIYLVQADGQSSTYIEYIAYTSGESIVVEQIGDTEIDLSDYATKSELEELEEKLEANNSSITPIFDHVPNTPAGEIRSIQYGNGVWIATSSVAPGIWRSTDNGKSWTSITTADGGSAINGCGVAYYWAAKGMWFVGGYATAQAGLYTSTDNGATWTKVTTAAGLTDIAPACFAASDSLIVAGLLAGKGVITSTDGVTWSVAATTAINSTPVTAAVYANGTWYFGVRGTAAAGNGKGGVWSTTDPRTTNVTAVDNTNIPTGYQVDRLHYIDGVVYASATNYPAGGSAPANPNAGIYKLDGTTWTKIDLNRPDGTVETGVYYAYDMVKLDGSIYASLWSGNGNVLKLNAEGAAFDYVSTNFLLDLGYDGQIYALGGNGTDTLITGHYNGKGLFIASVPSTFASQTGLRAVEESLNAKIDTVANSVSSAITDLDATIKDASENEVITITQTNGKLESVSLSIGNNSAQGANGVSLTQAANGKVTLSVAPGTVADNSTGFVTGDAVKTATDAATTKVTSTAGEDDVVVGKVTSASNTDGSTTYTVDAAPRITLAPSQFGTTVKGVKGDKVILEDGSVIYVDWSRVESAENLFANCETIEYFCADLINLKDGDGMFNGCTSLATFCGNLGSLDSGVDMFSGCILDIDSAVYIVDSLPDYEDGSTHSITIGLSEGAVSAEELASLAGSTSWTIN